MNESLWHIVYTRPQREKKVAQLIARKGLRTYCPLNNFQVKYGSRKKIVGEPLFVSYVFVNLNDQQRGWVKQTAGVINLVYRYDHPAIIRNEEIAAINFFLQDFPSVVLEKINMNCDEPVRVINEQLMTRKGNVMEVSNAVSKVVLPSLGYALVADTKKENSESFIYREEPRIRV